MPHHGPPTAEYLTDPPNLQGAYFAYNEACGPVVILIEGTDDKFLPVFNSEAHLHRHMNHLEEKLNIKIAYKLMPVLNPEGFLESITQMGVRVMINPEVIDDHHTRWTEVVKSEDTWKYFIQNAGGDGQQPGEAEKT